MARYLLDANAVSDLDNDPRGRVAAAGLRFAAANRKSHSLISKFSRSLRQPTASMASCAPISNARDGRSGPTTC